MLFPHIRKSNLLAEQLILCDALNCRSLNHMKFRLELLMYRKAEIGCVRLQLGQRYEVLAGRVRESQVNKLTDSNMCNDSN